MRRRALRKLTAFWRTWGLPLSVVEPQEYLPARGRAFALLVSQSALLMNDYAWSSSNALCSTRTASSVYFSSITTVILISEVEIVSMLMFAVTCQLISSEPG